MENNTPNPLTVAIEEALNELKEHPAMKAANGAIVLQAVRMGGAGYQGPLLTDFLREKMQQAHALGKQEGMNEGAESAVEYIIREYEKYQPSPEGRRIFEVARTAHRGDSV